MYILNTISTLFLEPKIIAEAVLKINPEVKLPKNYWRIEVLKPFFGDFQDFPYSVKSHFCPLFWLSNIFPVLWVWAAIRYCWNKLGDFKEDIKDYFCEKRAKKQKMDEEFKYKLWRERVEKCLVQDIGTLNEESIDWEDELELYELEDFEFDRELTEEEYKTAFSKENTLFRVSYDFAMIIARIKNPDNYKEIINKAYEENNIRLERERKEEEEREKVIRAKKAESQKRQAAIMNKLVKSSKNIFKYGSLTFAAISFFFIVKLIVSTWSFITGSFLWFVSLVWDNVFYITGTFVLIIATVFLGKIIAGVAVMIKENQEYSPTKEKIKQIFINIFKWGTCPVWIPLGLGLMAGQFIVDFFKMFYAENCPAISVEEDKK